MWWLIIPVTIYSAIIFALWLVLKKIRMPDLPLAENRTFFSVVVACHNEKNNIKPLLSCLIKQNYPPGNFEILIADDNSTDGTADLVIDFISCREGFNKNIIKLLHNTGKGKKAALRHAMDEARGEVIIVTDADCRMGQRWISAYSAYYEKCGADMMLGSVSDTSVRRFSSLLAKYEFSALQGITEAAVHAGHPVMCNGANMAFRRDVYLRYSAQLHDDIPSGDDMFLLHAVKHGGGRIKFLGCGAAAVETAAAVSAAALLSQRARWASKAFLYRDTDTLALAAATAACNAAVTAAAVTSLFSPDILIITALLYTIRLVPDYLIINHPMKKRKEHMPLHHFIIMELIYPFYFITVALLSLLPPMRQFRKHN